MYPRASSHGCTADLSSCSFNCKKGDSFDSNDGMACDPHFGSHLRLEEGITDYILGFTQAQEGSINGCNYNYKALVILGELLDEV